MTKANPPKLFSPVKIIAFIVFVSTLLTATWVLYRETRNKTQQVNNYLLEARRLLNSFSAVKASQLSLRNKRHDVWLPSEDPVTRRQREDSIVTYMQIALLLQKSLEHIPQNREIKDNLQQVYKEVALLAIDGQQYALSKIAAERCTQLGYPDQAEQLNHLLNQKRDAGSKQRLRHLRAIMAKIDKETSQPLLSLYRTQITRMAGVGLIAPLISYLHSGNLRQQLLAIELLGELGDSHSKVNGKDSVQWLIEKLQSLRLSDSQQRRLAIIVIIALGKLQDQRAALPVHVARQKVGYDTRFWQQTSVAAGWIPCREKQPAIIAEDYYRQAQRKWQQHDWRAVIDHADEAIKQAPQFTAPYVLRGRASEKLGRRQQALQDYKLATSQSQQCREAFFYLGEFLRKAGNRKEAMANYQQAVKIDPTYAAPYYPMGIISEEQRQLDAALHNFTLAIALSPDNAQAYSSRGIVYMRNGLREKALQDLNRAIELEPTLKEAYNDRGNVYKENQEYAKAIADYSQAIKLDARFPWPYYGRAVAYLKSKKQEQADKDFLEFLRLAPNTQQSHGVRRYLRSRGLLK